MNQEFNEDVIDIKPEKMNLKGFKKFKNYIGLIIVLLFVVIGGFKSFYILESGKSAVVLRFGEILKVEKVAGVKFKMPYIDQAVIVDTEKKYTVEYGYRTVRRGNEKSAGVSQNIEEESTIIVDAANNNASIVLLDLYAQYQIEDPAKYLFKVDDLEGTLRIALEEVVRTSFQDHTLDEARQDKEIIDSQMLPALQKKMNEYDSGLKIITIQSSNVELLPTVQEAYQQKENANQYKKGKIEEAEKYQNTQEPMARATAAKMVEDALGYKADVTAKAQADVAQFNALYEQYKQNPDIVKEQYYIETMREFIKNNKVIIDGTKEGQFYKEMRLFDDLTEKQN